MRLAQNLDRGRPVPKPRLCVRTHCCTDETWLPGPGTDCGSPRICRKEKQKQSRRSKSKGKKGTITNRTEAQENRLADATQSHLKKKKNIEREAR